MTFLPREKGEGEGLGEGVDGETGGGEGGVREGGGGRGGLRRGKEKEVEGEEGR